MVQHLALEVPSIKSPVHESHAVSSLSEHSNTRKEAQAGAHTAVTEVMSSRISSVPWVSRLPGLVADTGCRTTWGSPGAPKAEPEPHLCLYPRNGVGSDEASASAELTP